MGRRIFEVVVGIILLVLAFVLAFFFQQEYTSGVELQSLPVPVDNIGPYTLLSESMFVMKDFPRKLTETGAYATSLSQLDGRISTSIIPAGLPVPLVEATKPEDFRLADPNLEVLSIPISPTSAVGGQIRIGDRINIYRIYPPSKAPVLQDRLDTSDMVTLVAENIPVVLVLGGGSSSGGSTSANILVLALTQPEKEAILQLIADTKENAFMWITLAPVTTVGPGTTGPIG